MKNTLLLMIFILYSQFTGVNLSFADQIKKADSHFNGNPVKLSI